MKTKIEKLSTGEIFDSMTAAAESAKIYKTIFVKMLKNGQLKDYRETSKGVPRYECRFYNANRNRCDALKELYCKAENCWRYDRRKA